MSQIRRWHCVISGYARICVSVRVRAYACCCLFMHFSHTSLSVFTASHNPVMALTFHGWHRGASTRSHQNFIPNYGSDAGGRSRPPRPRGKLLAETRPAGAGQMKSISTRLLTARVGRLVILNAQRTQINGLNDLEISVPTGVLQKGPQREAIATKTRRPKQSQTQSFRRL